MQGDHFCTDQVTFVPVSKLTHVWRLGKHGLSCFQTSGNTHVHVSKVFADIGCRAPFACFGKRVALVFSRVPEFDEGGVGWGVGGDVD
jgi:hypothetical protein